MLRLEAALAETAPDNAHLAEEVAGIFQPMSLQKGEFLLQAGQVCQWAVFIEAGVMRNFHHDENGEEVVNYMPCSGGFNTIYPSFLQGVPAAELIQAVTPCQLRAISREQYLQHSAQHEGFRQLTQAIIAHGLACKDTRIKGYLTQSAAERYETLLRTQPQVVQQAPLQYIASYLGMSRETLSRIRSRKLPNAQA